MIDERRPYTQSPIEGPDDGTKTATDSTDNADTRGS